MRAAFKRADTPRHPSCLLPDKHHMHTKPVRTQALAFESRGSGPLPGKALRRACSWGRQPEGGGV